MKPSMTGTSFFHTLSPHGSQKNPDQEKPEGRQKALSQARLSFACAAFTPENFISLYLRLLISDASAFHPAALGCYGF